MAKSPTPSAKDAAQPESNGFAFVRLLKQPEIQQLMRADMVNEADLLTMLNTVSKQLRANSQITTPKRKTTAGNPGEDDSGYRLGVGIMLLNQRGEVFVGQRADVKGEAWQMPQGGIEPGETPEQAARRELKEEIGTDNADFIAEAKQWFYYKLPPKLAKHARHQGWIGQKQKWFVMIFKGDDSEINLGDDHREFSNWQWVPLQQLPELAISFKRQLYLNLLGEFGTIFRD